MSIYKIIIILRHFIFDFNDKFPNLGKPLLVGWNILHKIKFFTKKIGLEGRGLLKYNSSKFALNKILWINPQKINFYLSKNSLKLTKSSLKSKNDWDLSKKTIKESLIYKTLHQKFINGKNWEEIEQYNLILNQISKGEISWACNIKKELDDKLGELENFSEIIVAIDRDGQFIVIEGIANFLIARFLKIPKIPVHIKIRHKAWVVFKKKLYYFSTNYRNRKIYQRITHPDLQNIPFTHGDFRFNIIKENLSFSRGTVLDIGANLGYFSRKFEDEGFNCYVVEINKLYVYFLTKLKKAENRKYKIIPKSIFNYKRNQELHFDIVLALNIFHHFLKRKNTYLNLINLLKRLKTKELFIEVHNPNEFLNLNVYRNYNPQQFVDFIIENSCLNKAQLLIKLGNGRRIYKLTAD